MLIRLNNLKEVLKNTPGIKFLLRKNRTVKTKGYTHALYFSFFNSEKLEKILLNEGYAYSRLIGCDGKYAYVIYLKYVGTDITLSNTDKRLWVCPECGSVHRLAKEWHPILKYYERTVCDACVIQGHYNYSPLRLIC